MKASKTSGANRAFYLIIAVIAIGGIAALTYESTRSTTPQNVSQIDTTLPKVVSQGYVLGSATAPLEVTEFADFECPVCGRFATLSEPDVRTQLINTGKIRLRFIDFPLDIHHNTWNASRAAACADEQGKFWEMHDAIFARQDQWNSEATNDPDKILKDIGKSVVPNAGQLNQCIDSKKTQAKVQAHWQLAMDRHVNATPTFLIGTHQIAQYLTSDQFKQLVDSAIAKGPGPAVGGDTATTATPTKASAKSAKAK